MFQIWYMGSHEEGLFVEAHQRAKKEDHGGDRGLPVGKLVNGGDKPGRPKVCVSWED